MVEFITSQHFSNKPSNWNNVAAASTDTTVFGSNITSSKYKEPKTTFRAANDTIKVNLSDYLLIDGQISNLLGIIVHAYIPMWCSDRQSRYEWNPVHVLAMNHWTCWKNMHFGIDKFCVNAILCPMPLLKHRNFAPPRRMSCKCIVVWLAIFSWKKNYFQSILAK